MKALFAAKVNTPTDVVEGADGIYRIGRVTEIAPETVDAEYQTKLTTAGIDLAKYRQVVQGDVIRQKLEDKIVAAVDRTRPAAARPGDLHQGSPLRFLAPTRSRFATSSTRPRTTRAVHRRSTPAIRPGRPPRTKRTRRTSSSRPIRACSTRSPGPRATRRATWATPGPAASCRTSTRAARSTTAFKAAILAPGLQPGQLLPPGQVGVRLARHPGHVPSAGPRLAQRAQDQGRRRRRLCHARPQQLRGHHGRRRRRRGLDRQGPARRRR